MQRDDLTLVQWIEQVAQQAQVVPVCTAFILTFYKVDSIISPDSFVSICILSGFLNIT